MTTPLRHSHIIVNLHALVKLNSVGMSANSSVSRDGEPVLHGQCDVRCTLTFPANEQSG